MEILAGLNHVSVTRLKEEFSVRCPSSFLFFIYLMGGRHSDAAQRLPQKHVQLLADLNATVDNQHNYRVYRDLLQSRKPPCVPYLGTYSVISTVGRR